MTHLVVGCPVYERAWIMPTWFEAVERLQESFTVELVFVYTPSSDGTGDLIATTGDMDRTIIEYVEGDHSIERRWGLSRYATMADMRNVMLAHVRNREPDLFLSLDSDIIVRRPADVRRLAGHVARGADAASPCVFLAPGLTNAFIRRGTGPPSRVTFYEGVHRGVFALAGAVAMGPAAYCVDYESDVFGEDFGWAKNAAGLSLVWDATMTWQHHMKKPVREGGGM